MSLADLQALGLVDLLDVELARAHQPPDRHARLRRRAPRSP